MFKKSRVYLDYAAATPLCKAASGAMKEIMDTVYGNPSAVHKEGQLARQHVEEARVQVARSAQIKPEYVTFTSGGTEANNIAIVGCVEQLHHSGRAYEDMQVITTRIEHPATTESVLSLAKRGVEVQFVDVDETGRIQANHLRTLLSEKTVLVSYTYANSEVGTIQPLHQLQKIITTAERNFGTEIIIHLDAAQAPMWLNCQFDSLKADAVSLDFSKCGGPKGSGALLRSRRVALTPVLHGGGQEQGLRSGTENVLGIVGGAVALAVAQRNYKSVAEQTRKVRDAGISALLELDKQVVLNGPTADQRIPNNINISLPAVDTEYLTVWLDTEGFAVSTKSACAGAGGGKSTVVFAMTNDDARSAATLRITLSPETTVEQLTKLSAAITKHLSLMSGLTEK